MTAAVTAAHEYMRPRVRAGGIGVDATAGRGHDTVFLARLLGPEGVVHACDVQPAALAATQQRWLTLAAPKAELHLHACGHESMKQSLADQGVTQLQAVIFNLGYLPGTDHAITTSTATTLTALQDLLTLLTPGGILTVVAYPGHPGGREELDAILTWARQLPPAIGLARHLQWLNLGPDRAEMIAIEADPTDWSA
jgi:predicted methyltransferase